MFPTLPDLTGYLDPARVIFLPGSPSKREALLALIGVLVREPQITNADAFIQAIFDREEVTSTGIGGAVAVPHAQLPSITGFLIAIAICPQGVAFIAKDDQPVKVLVMIAAPSSDRQAYLKTLANVAAHLNREGVVRAMLAVTSAPAAIAAFLDKPGAMNRNRGPSASA